MAASREEPGIEISVHPAAAVGGRRVDRSRAARTLTAAEIESVLSRNWWGVLATSVDNRPYAVPVAYGWTGIRLYIACLDGRKAANLRANPHACLTVSSVASGAAWESAIVAGPIEWVKGPAQLFTAFTALARQCHRPFVPPSPERLRSARVFSVIPEEISGRARD